MSVTASDGYGAAFVLSDDDAVDVDLLARAEGPVLDVGCGPGRLSWPDGVSRPSASTPRQPPYA